MKLINIIIDIYTYLLSEGRKEVTEHRKQIEQEEAGDVHKVFICVK